MTLILLAAWVGTGGAFSQVPGYDVAVVRMTGKVRLFRVRERVRMSPWIIPAIGVASAVPPAAALGVDRRLPPAPRFSLGDYVRLAFDEIRHYSGRSIRVTRRLTGTVEDLLAVAPPRVLRRRGQGGGQDGTLIS